MIMPRMIMATITTAITKTTTNIATTIITTTITPMLMTTSEPAPADASSGMNADEAAALYRLMTWLSPSFPVGAFSYSGGIEWVVEAGDITDAASLRDWLAAMLTGGSGFGDARVPACRGVKLDFRRRPPCAARTNRQPAHSRKPRSRCRGHRQARAHGFARRSRQRHLPRRSRQPAPRDAVYAAVPVMMREA